MGITKKGVKVIYFRIRQAIIVVAPILSYANFTLIAYNFTDLKNLIPFEIFAPVFTIGLLIIFAFIGKAFYKIQMGTDFDQTYFKAHESAKSLRILYDMEIAISKQLGIEISDEAKERHKLLKEIEDMKY